METTIIYRGYIGIMEKKMETTTRVRIIVVIVVITIFPPWACGVSKVRSMGR